MKYREINDHCLSASSMYVYSDIDIMSMLSAGNDVTVCNDYLLINIQCNGLTFVMLLTGCCEGVLSVKSGSLQCVW